jgi:hypothetical protein
MFAVELIEPTPPTFNVARFDRVYGILLSHFLLFDLNISEIIEIKQKMAKNWSEN